MKKIYIFFLILSTFLKSQKITYSEKYYGQESGISQSTIKSIVKDRYGFIWMSTENGIVRFDGKNIKIYNIDRSESENRPMLIDGTADDDWLYTFYDIKGTSALIKKRDLSIIRKDSLSYKELIKHEEENSYKMNKYSTEAAKKNEFTYYVSKKEYYLLENYKLFYINKNKKKYLKTLKGYNYLNFFLLNKQLFYLKNHSEVEKIDTLGNIIKYPTGIIKKEKDYQLFINNANKQILIRNNNLIYTLDYLDSKLSLSKIFDYNRLNNILISSMYYDKIHQTLFIGTHAKGLLVVRENIISTYQSPNSFNTSFHSLSKFNNEQLITSRGEIFNKNGYLKKIWFNNDLDPYGILTLNFESKFLVKNENKLIFINKNKEDVLIDYGNRSYIHYIGKGKNNRIWFSLKNHDINIIGYLTIENNRIKEKKTYQTKRLVRSILELNEKETLLATEDGLFLLNKEKEIIKTLAENINFRGINRTSNSITWIYTYRRGFYLYMNGRLYPPNHKINILSSVHWIIEDNYGYYWLSSNNGLFQIKKENLIDYYTNNIDNLYIHKYDIDDGLLTNEFNGGSNTNGISLEEFIIFPSMNGIVFINTVKARSLAPYDDYYIDRILINGQNKTIKNNSLSLERNFINLKIYVDYPNYRNTNSDNIEYKIDDKPWEVLQESRVLYINSLKNGSHQISFRKLKTFSSDYNYKVLNIYVKPAFWETSLFKVFIIVCLLLLFYIFYRIRINKIEKEKIILNSKIDQRTNELKKTIESLSITREELYEQLKRHKKMAIALNHDIKSPLKFIKLSSEYLLENKKNTSEHNKIISSIKDSSFQMLEFIESNINYNKAFVYDNNKNKEDVRIYDLIEKKIAIFKNIAEHKSLIIENKVNKNLIVRINVDILSIIIHNIIDNAIKYTPKGYFYIYTNELKNYNIIELIFEDTGVGMTNEEIKNILALNNNQETKLGMKIIKELLPLIDAKITIKSTKNSGSKIILILNLV